MPGRSKVLIVHQSFIQILHQEKKYREIALPPFITIYQRVMYTIELGMHGPITWDIIRCLSKQPFLGKVQGDKFWSYVFHTHRSSNLSPYFHRSILNLHVKWGKRKYRNCSRIHFTLVPTRKDISITQRGKRKKNQDFLGIELLSKHFPPKVIYLKQTYP